MEKNGEYYDFIECLIKEIQEFTQSRNVTITFCPAGQGQDNEDILRVEIPMQRETGVHRLRVEKLYQQKESTNLKGIRELVWSEIGVSLADSTANILNGKLNYNQIKEHLIVCLCHYDSNDAVLNDKVYSLIGDIALVLYINIGYIEKQYYSGMVPSKLLSVWDKEKIDVMEVALENTLRLYPPVICEVDALNYPNRYAYYDFMHTNPNILNKVLREVVCVTTKNSFRGAAAIFMPGIVKHLGNVIGNDYYIVFINEDFAAIYDICLVTEEDLKYVLNATKAKNRFFSSKLYYYSRNQDQIEVIV